MKWLVKGLTLSFVLSLQTVNAQGINSKPCFSNGWSEQKLTELARSLFQLDSESLSEFLPQLKFCLADINPKIRDGVAYAGFTRWLRREDIAEKDRLALFEQLISDIENNVTDANGVYLPFAVLVMSEVARSDRVTPYLTAQQRQRMVSAVHTYMLGLDDYRGFDQQQGWRHGVAHAADWVLQLALNDNINQTQLKVLADAIVAQISANNSHFYIYGEPDRLARAAAYLMMREELDDAYWKTWFNTIGNPAPFDNWAQMYQSQQGLAKRHNNKQFLLSLYRLFAGAKEDRAAHIIRLTKRNLKGIR